MPRHKIGRNEPCWCGSGKKFKRCHLERDKQKPSSLWENDKELRKAFSSKVCSTPEDWHIDCSKQISKAHTVPKSGSLRKIARKGLVYAFVPSLENLKKNNGVFVPELIGINKASTFSGFCSYHDGVIFSPVEQKPFVGSPEQCFLRNQ